MTANPVDLIGGLTTSAPVAKADISAWAKARVPAVLANAAELRGTALANQLVVMVTALGTFYAVDPTDTTTADDGINCIISSDGLRFKQVSAAMMLGTVQTVTGAKTFNDGKLILAGVTSGTTTLKSGAIAGTSVVTLPVATDTLVGKATTDTLTNKTFDTAGTGNAFSINGLAATANSGTGAVVRATSPTLVTPALGTAASGVLSNCTGLPLSGLVAQAAFTLVGNNTGGSAVPAAVDIAALTTKASPAGTDYVMISDQAASGAWKKALISGVAGAGSVSSIAGNTGAFTLGTGLTNTVNDIEVALSKFSAALGADVALNNTSNYFDGPSVAQGTSGIFFVFGKVTLKDTGGAANLLCKLWDGTTVIDSAQTVSNSTSPITVTLGGFITNPAANCKISVRDSSATTGVMLFNQSGNGKDSTISAIRIG